MCGAWHAAPMLCRLCGNSVAKHAAAFKYILEHIMENCRHTLSMAHVSDANVCRVAASLLITLALHMSVVAGSCQSYNSIIMAHSIISPIIVS